MPILLHLAHSRCYINKSLLLIFDKGSWKIIVSNDQWDFLIPDSALASTTFTPLDFHLVLWDRSCLAAEKQGEDQDISV